MINTRDEENIEEVKKIYKYIKIFYRLFIVIFIIYYIVNDQYNKFHK